MAKDAYRYFRIEARELLDEMSKAALDLEKGADRPGALNRLLRLAHTLKGAARVVRQPGMAEHAHAIEDELVPLRGVVETVTADQVSTVLAHLDAIEAGLAALPSAQDQAQTDDKGPEGATPLSGGSQVPAAQGLSKGAAADHPVEQGWYAGRTPSDDLQAVLGGLTESHVHVATLVRHHQTAERARQLADSLLGQLTQRRTRSAKPQGGQAQLGAAQDMAGELRGILQALSTGLAQTGDLLSRELRQTRDLAEQLKLVAAQGVFTLLERTARDVARMQGKDVTFQASGGDVRLDAGLLAAVQAALIQMVRNAVAHGIEPPEVRVAAGKTAQGTVRVSVRQDGRHVFFTVEDDGAGLDISAVVRTARQRGLLPDDGSPVDERTLLQLLMQGGVSTAAEVTEVSGRGIGLNVVADAMAQWHGEASMETAPGKGTSLVLSFPMSMASLATLNVMVGDTKVSIPLDAVARTMRLSSEDIIPSNSGRVILMDGRPVPFLPLARAMRLPNEEPLHWSVVVVKSDKGMAAFGVVRLMEVSQIVLRPMPPWTPVSPVVAGVTLDVEGRPQAVLSPAGLVREAASAPAVAAVAPPRHAPVLVIDDSLTTRMLEQSILETAGYTVDTAVSAEEGLQKARDGNYALFLVDVDMPGMDGFTFVQTIRGDPVLRTTPAILVTSRSSEEDRERGRAVGASDYIVKGDFAQNAFLDSVRCLIRSQ